ncbi:MAG: tRNA pseudouridine(38-40) synthase TruA [Lachnospiraceae bacterium]|nr:tRNA pseudouridine(38-40) synthase TruA [Lachnospiraceae bacterium]
MRRIKLKVAYDGTNYAGWQIQKNALTIEEILNKTISKLTEEDIAIIGASRTDSGVHALGNICVFDTNSKIAAEKFSFALNTKLPEDIVIVSSEEVDVTWHPRYQHNIIKSYEYRIFNGKFPNPLRNRYTTFVSFNLDVEKMKEAAKYIIGEHDFKSFCNIRTNAKTTVRTVTELSIEKEENEIVLRISGNGFLYNMVRIIAGTLIRVGRGFYEPEQVKEIIESRRRNAAGVTVPPNGLTLLKIEYPN